MACWIILIYIHLNSCFSGKHHGNQQLNCGQNPKQAEVCQSCIPKGGQSIVPGMDRQHHRDLRHLWGFVAKEIPKDTTSTRSRGRKTLSGGEESIFKGKLWWYIKSFWGLWKSCFVVFLVPQFWILVVFKLGQDSAYWHRDRCMVGAHLWTWCQGHTPPQTPRHQRCQVLGSPVEKRRSHPWSTLGCKVRAWNREIKRRQSVKS